MQSDIVTSTVESQSALLDEIVRFSSRLSTTLRGHTSSVNSVAFSPDGATLASASGDDTIRLWDVATGQPRTDPLRGHTDSVVSVAFSPDGATLASASGDDTIRLWDVSVESWKRRICHIVNRNLTLDEWRQYMGEEPYERTCPALPGPEQD